MQIRTEIEIAAGAGLIWAELMRFTAWPEWNPFIPRIEGKAYREWNTRPGPFKPLCEPSATFPCLFLAIPVLFLIDSFPNSQRNFLS
jgi:hypothetical protein